MPEASPPSVRSAASPAPLSPAAPAPWPAGPYACLSRAAVTEELDFDPSDPRIVHTCEPGDRVEMAEIGRTGTGQVRGRIAEGWVSLISTEGNVLFEVAAAPAADPSLLQGPFKGLSTTLDQLEAGMGGAQAAPRAAPRPRLELPDAEARDALFRRMDTNGNGLLSLEDIDTAVKTLYPQFDHKPALMRAYNAADDRGDGWLGQREFRQLLRYLVYFNQLWDDFEQIDLQDERKITVASFMQGCSAVGLQISAEEAQAQFEEMDTEQAGAVPFDDFCTFCARKHLSKFDQDAASPRSGGEEQPRRKRGSRGGRRGAPRSPDRAAQAQRAHKRRSRVHNGEMVELLRTKLRGLSYDHNGQNPAKLFEMYDSDNSGSLEYEEFRAAVRKGGKITDNMLSEKELEQLFDTVDTDYSGSISIDELTNFVWGVGAPQSPAAGSPAAGGAAQPQMEDLYEQFATSAPRLDESGDSPPPPRALPGGIGAWGDESSPSPTGRDSELVFDRLAAHRSGNRHGAGAEDTRRVRGLVSPPRQRPGVGSPLGPQGEYARVRGLVSPPRQRPKKPAEREYLDHTGRVPTAKTVKQSSLRRLASPPRRGRELEEHRRSKRGARGAASEEVWWSKTGDSRAAKPAWTSNTKPPALKRGERGAAAGGGAARGTPRVNPRSKKMMQGRPSATSGDLVSRLHALHQQRNERLDTLRAEVDRQRRDKEDAMASSTRFRATPIKTGAGGASSGGDGRRVEDRLISFGRDKQRRTSQKAETVKKQEAVHNFSPQINKKSRAAAGGRSVAAMHDWEAQRRMKLEEKRRARAEAEVAGAPFRPSISPAAKKMQPAVPVHSRLHEVRLSVLTCVFAAPDNSLSACRTGGAAKPRSEEGAQDGAPRAGEGSCVIVPPPPPPPPAVPLSLLLRRLFDAEAMSDRQTRFIGGFVRAARESEFSVIIVEFLLTLTDKVRHLFAQNQQQPFLAAGSVSSCSTATRPPLRSARRCCPSSSRVPASSGSLDATSCIIFLTFCAVLAEVSMYIMPCSAAKASAASVVTSRSSSRSALLPTSTRVHVGPRPLARTSCSQRSPASNDCLSDTANTSTTTSAPR